MPVNQVRRNGSYAPLSAHYYKDDALVVAGPWPELLYVRGLAFCAEVLSDGYISDAQLVRFVGAGMAGGDKAVRTHADTLVQVGLWVRDDGGYTVRSWAKWNLTRAEIDARRRKDTGRKGGAT